MGLVEKVIRRDFAFGSCRDAWHRLSVWYPVTIGVPANSFTTATNALSECDMRTSFAFEPVRELHYGSPMLQLMHHNGVATPPLSTPVWTVDQKHRFGATSRMASGNRIEEFRKAKDWSRPKLAEAMNTSTQQVERLEKGQRRLTVDWMERAAAALGCAPADLLIEDAASPAPNARVVRYEGSSSDRPRNDLPVYGTALGATRKIEGEAREQTMLNSGEVIRYVRRPPILNGRADVYGFYVVGSSMEPVYMEGEMAIAESKRPARIGDDVVVYLRADGEGEDDGQRARGVLVKRLVRRTARYIELEQFNPPNIFKIPADDVVRSDRVMRLADLLD